MKMRVLTTFALLLSLLAPVGFAQESDSSAQEEAENRLEKIKSDLESEDWDSAFGNMTEDARNQFCVEQVMICGSFLQIANSGMPGMEGMADGIKEVFEAENLDEIEMPQMSCGPGGCQDMQAEMAKLPAIEKDVLKLLKESGKQNEIAGSLYNALSDVPMSPRVFSGDVVSAEVDGDMALLRIGGGDGMLPDRFLIFEKQDDDFLYAGIDQVKSAQAAGEFMQKMMGGMGQGMPPGMGPGMPPGMGPGMPPGMGPGMPPGMGPKGGSNPDDF